MADVSYNHRKESKLRRKAFGKEKPQRTHEEINRIVKVLNSDGTLKGVLYDQKH